MTQGNDGGETKQKVDQSSIVNDSVINDLQAQKPRPKEYLFATQQKHTGYLIHTILQIFTNAKSNAGILKDVNVHSLRHDFATHFWMKEQL